LRGLSALKQLANPLGKPKNPRRSAGYIQITALPDLKKAKPWYAGIDSTVLQQNVKSAQSADTLETRTTTQETTSVTKGLSFKVSVRQKYG